jgi:23S rRNA (cytidine1920-2'-O)/16S rRNA (cytidine1409-2'-O)-methyltransferase
VTVTVGTVSGRRRERLDQLLVVRGLAGDISLAQRYVMAGQVLVDDRPAGKAGDRVSCDAVLRLRTQESPWASRAGLKLRHALDTWSIPVDGCICLDVGASTGGFTDVLLAAGACRVYAVDVGYGILAWRLAQDPRVVNLERTNIRFLRPEQIPEPVDLLVMDVSFIALEQVLPVAIARVRPGGTGVVLIKPQFELARHQVGAGGIVRSAVDHQQAVDKVSAAAVRCGCSVAGVSAAPITGARGNQEFLMYFTVGAPMAGAGGEEAI